MKRLFALAVALALPLLALGQLSPDERQAIGNALYLRNLTPKDLDFVRRSKSGPVPLPAIAEAIDRPLESADALMRLHRSAGESLAATLPVALAQLQVSAGVASEGAKVTLPDSVPPSLRIAVGELLTGMAAANVEIRAAIEPLSPNERRALIDTLPQMAAGKYGRLSFVRNGPAAREAIENLLKRIDLKRLMAASAQLSRVVESQLAALRTVDPKSVDAPIRFTAAGIPVEIAGGGPDFHDGSVGGLCIDLGGNDVYTGRYGSGTLASSVLIDLGGDDDYQVGDLSIGSGLLGIGLAYDLGGHDRFHGKSLCFGAGMAGVGALMKEGGDDDYVSQFMSQGFGARGLGLLLDTRGDDRHRIEAMGEGAGFDRGLGWLIDRSGGDTYVSSGAWAQGSGRAGIGLLTDLVGDDTYSSTSSCQAAGEAEGLGSLFDGAGRDSYTCDHEGTSFADEGAAYLFDLSGDDIYASRGGSCHATSQGRGVAVLIDREGDDLYASSDGRPALATDGGLALFYDGAGHDRYTGSPAGAVGGRRGDALGIFIDAGGQDGYCEGLDDGSARVDPDGAVAFDVDAFPAASPVSGLGPKVGSLPDPGVDAIDALVAEGSNDKLIGIGLPAFQRLLDRHLASADPERMGMIVRLGRLLGDPARPIVASKLKSPNDEELRRLLQLVTWLGIPSASGRVLDLLKRPEVQREAVEAAGVLRLREAVPDILPLAASSDPDLALAAMLALDRINDESALATAQALVKSPELPVRRAAMRLVSRYSASAVTAAERLLAEPDERSQRLGIELLGMTGTDDSLLRASKYLVGGTPGLRIQAMIAVQGRCPLSARASLVGLRNDPDPLVRAVAARLDPGR